MDRDRDKLLSFIGNRLREWRKGRGWTQERLGLEAGVSTDAVRRIEGARFAPSVVILEKLVRACSGTLDAFFATPNQKKALSGSLQVLNFHGELLDEECRQALIQVASLLLKRRKRS